MPGRGGLPCLMPHPMGAGCLALI